MKRWVAAAMLALRKASMAITPATMLKMPKSSTPRAFRTRRVAYRETNMVTPIFIYRNPVFLITLETVFMKRWKKKIPGKRLRG